MSRLLLAAAVAAILVLVGVFVPIDGRTLVERWRGAPSATHFAERGWNDVVARWDALWGAKPPARPASRVTTKGGAPGKPAQAAPTQRPVPEPAEHHTDEDRRALDQIVAEHSRDPRPSGR